MDVEATLRYLTEGSTLGVMTDSIECHRVRSTGMIEISRPDSESVEMTTDEFREGFRLQTFRKLKNNDHAQ